MPNYCNYAMKVVGAKENIEEFCKVIQADYDYNKKEFSFGRHLCRVFEADIDEVTNKHEDIWFVEISGYCAWSVHTCMLQGEHTYHDSIIKDYPEPKVTSLLKESKNLNLKIEVFGSEPGVGFQEHYLIENGSLNINEERKYREYCFEDYKDELTQGDVDRFNQENDTKFTLEDFDTDTSCFIEGGFDNWGKFDI